MPYDGVFEPDGPLLVPTPAARGVWDEDALHGAAVAALFAGRMALEDRTLARLTVEMLAPVPFGPVKLDVGEAAGGRRVVRREAVLTAGERVVASARSVHVRTAAVDLPAERPAAASPFDPGLVPALDSPRPDVMDFIGWESFDTTAVVTEHLPCRDDRGSVCLWFRLLLPIVAGEDIAGVELAAAAGDYAQSGTGQLLPFDRWRFLNAELTVHLTRAPRLPWLGLRCQGLVQPVGAGLSSAELYDASGRIGQCGQALVVEERGRSGR